LSDIKRDVQAMTTFRRNPGKFLKQLKKTKKPVILTINGKAEAVVQDADACQRLPHHAAQADQAEGVRQGVEDFKEGRTRLGKLSKNSAAVAGCLVRLSARALRDVARIYDNIEAYGLGCGFDVVSGARGSHLQFGALSRARKAFARENKKRRILFFGRKPNIYKIIYEVDLPDVEVKTFHIRRGARRGSRR
jgi:prevent-host-death family protein